MTVANANFVAFARRLAPRRLSFEWGQRFISWIAAPFDVLADSFQYAVGCRFPSIAPDDALPYIGRDRQITSGPAEPIDSYRRRLQGAFSAWQWAGTEKAIIDQLEAYGFDSPVIVENHEWSVEYPHDSDNWSRFWVILTEGTHSFSTSISAEEQLSISRVVHQWKAAHVVCVEVIAIVSGRLVDWPAPVRTVDEIASSGELVDDNVSLRFGG